MDIHVNFRPCSLYSFLQGQPVGLVPELEALGGAVLLLSLTTRHPWGHTLSWLEMFHPTGFLESPAAMLMPWRILGCREGGRYTVSGQANWRHTA